MTCFFAVSQNLLRCAWSPDGRKVTAGSSDRYLITSSTLSAALQRQPAAFSIIISMFFLWYIQEPHVQYHLHVHVRVQRLSYTCSIIIMIIFFQLDESDIVLKC